MTKLVLALVAIAAVLAIVILSPNLSGVCKGTGEVLDFQRLRAAAIAGLIRNGGARYIDHPVDVQRLMRDGPIRYVDTADFLRTNPDCCSLVSEGEDGYRIGWWDRLSGGRAHLMQLDYLFRFRDAQGIATAVPTRQFVPLTACGGYRDLFD